MSIRERDYILRQIEQFAQALARIAGLKTARNFDEAALVIRETKDAILGPMARMVDGFDSPSAANLLGSAEKIRIYATLSAETASLLEMTANAKKKARSEYRRALELHLEAIDKNPALDDKTRDAILLLMTKVGTTGLDDRYRAILKQLGSISSAT